VLAERLRAQGFVVETAADGAAGAELALAQPPSAVVADLWMQGVSGIQLCRLLRAEAATADVPIILRSEQEDPKSRFWAERAGAVALVSKGRMGLLARTLHRTIASAPPEDTFFTQLSGGSHDIRDRIAQHLDAALFDSVVATEVRSLASAGSFDRLFDLLSQLLSQLMTYHWLAVTSFHPPRLAIHAHPRGMAVVETKAREVLELTAQVPANRILDEDAAEEDSGKKSRVLVRDILFAGKAVARIAVSPTRTASEADALVELIARELGGAIRLASLIEDSRQLATTDALTGLLNRRAFVEQVEREMQRSGRTGTPLSVVLLDIDHFKQINDRHGHASGDTVLSALGQLLPRRARACDVAGRWGGEEFVVLLPNTGATEAVDVAERLRAEIEALDVRTTSATRIPVTGSLGVATRRPAEGLDSLLDRADRSMYAAKSGGRNRVCLIDDEIVDVAPTESVPAAE
jgi:two-component system cell cycle response regulator